jgi:hypothetical protein
MPHAAWLLRLFVPTLRNQSIMQTNSNLDQGVENRAPTAAILELIKALARFAATRAQCERYDVFSDRAERTEIFEIASSTKESTL